MRLSPSRSIALNFAAFGFGYGLWAGGSAWLIARTGISVAAFGAALTAFTAVYLLAMGAASTLARLTSVKTVVVGSLVLAAPSLAIVLAASNPAELIGGLVLYGLFAGGLDSSMNAEAASYERQIRRPVMARFHGVASATVALSALLGGLVAGGPAAWLAPVLATIVFWGAAIALLSRPAIEGRPIGGVETPRVRVITQPLVVIGLVLGVSIACETAALAWSPSLLSREAPELAVLAGLGGAFFSGCQALLRLNADGVRARIDDRNLIALSLTVAAAGLALVTAPLGFAGSVLGFAIVGFGTGAVVPCGFALAGTRPGISAAASISAVSFFGIFARLPAPLATGFIASAFSLSAAFLALAVLLLVAAAAVLVLVPAPKIVLGRASP